MNSKIKNAFSYDSKAMDTFLKFLPMLFLFAGDLKFKTRHSWKKQLAISTTILISTNALIKPLKKVVHEQRPLPSLKQDSFPSGHTAAAFAEAEMLRQELKGSLPHASYSGYFIATGLGILRMVHRKHKPIDVIAGAVIGIASARLAYKLLFSGKKSTEVSPHSLFKKENPSQMQRVF